MNTTHSHAGTTQSRTRGTVLRFALVCAAALAITLVAMTTLAAPERTVTADNVVSFGSVKLKICEYELDAQGSEVAYTPNADGSYPDTQVSANASTVSRIVRLENTGDHEVYVRVRLRLARVTADGTQKDAGKEVGLFLNTSDSGTAWVRGDDGWYYYRGTKADGGIVVPGAQTVNLLTGLDFSAASSEKARNYRLVVDAQGVQAENQAGQDKGLEAVDVLTVRGWPEEE